MTQDPLVCFDNNSEPLPHRQKMVSYIIAVLEPQIWVYDMRFVKNKNARLPHPLGERNGEENTWSISFVMDVTLWASGSQASVVSDQLNII
jgi:hypothetical protein